MAIAKTGAPEGFRSPETWDLVRGVLDWRLWAFLGLQDIRQRYRRSLFGPLWLTLGLGVTVIGIGLLYSGIMKVEGREYIPFVAISFLLWMLISAVLSEATSLFLGARQVITSVKVPYTSFVLRCITRNLIVAAHGVIVVVGAFLWYRFPVTPMIAVSVLGLVLLCANLYWMALAIALLSARYRDVAQIVLYAVGIAFFMTPIVWMPNSVRVGSPFLHFNPFSQMIELVRGPVFFHVFPGYSFFYCSVMLVVGMALSLLFFIRSRRYLVYWV